MTLLQIDIENDKKPTIFQTSKFLCIFVKVSQTSCIGVFQRVNNEKIGTSSRFNEEIIVMFRMKMSQVDNENDKNPEIFSIFKDFMHFFPNFCQTSWIETLKRVNKEVMCYPVGFLEEISTVF